MKKASIIPGQGRRSIFAFEMGLLGPSMAVCFITIYILGLVKLPAASLQRPSAVPFHRSFFSLFIAKKNDTEEISMSFAAIRCIRIKSSICFKNPFRRFLWVSSKSIVDKAAKEGELRVFIVAGEVSGDTIASRLMASLKKLSPLPITFSGVGG
ncbi:hypothetical protein COLO4_04206 [Corchorus olitorius]|uniref:lipid-A-disaccharide synthase n=1 Tax=Corchorus olitorius TaxID=93759 RepID=A0A1R3KUX6_9ROSI|nr:hypothetical protein COLO4_04206 [Corchorus olitorius]